MRVLPPSVPTPSAGDNLEDGVPISSSSDGNERQLTSQPRKSFLIFVAVLVVLAALSGVIVATNERQTHRKRKGLSNMIAAAAHSSSSSSLPHSQLANMVMINQTNHAPEKLCFEADFDNNQEKRDLKVAASGKAYITWNEATETYSINSQIRNIDKKANEIIGYQLHSGDSNAKNGAACVVFCMSVPIPIPPLPAGAKAKPFKWRNGVGCPQTNSYSTNSGEFMFSVAETTNPQKQHFAADNDDMAVGLAPANRTVFNNALRQCTSTKKDCNVYFNLHTKYSWSKTHGMGLARGQLRPIACSDMINRKPKQVSNKEQDGDGFVE